MMARSRKNFKTKKKAKIFKISILKDKNFDLNKILEWIKVICDDKSHYQKHKKNVVFTFYNLDDAFRFKLRWESA